MSLDKPTQFRRYISSIELMGIGSAQAFVTARCYLAPVQIPVNLTIDRLGWLQDAVSAGNVRMGIYRDMGDTPLGGALVVESASVAKAGTARKMELTIAATQLSPGLYWVCVQSDEATSSFTMGSQDMSNGGTILTCQYDRGGGYGAFTNPCPAITTNAGVAIQFVRVKSIP